MKGRVDLCVKHSSNQRWVSDEVGVADERDRVLAGGARAMANVRSRTAAPPPPPAALPLPPAPSTASPPGGALPRVRGARRWCEMRRTSSLALAAAVVISGRTSASGRLYVLASRRLIRSPGRLRAEGCGWDGRGVVSARSVERTARRRAWTLQLESPQRAAAAACVHVVESGWGRASGRPSAEDIGARPKYKGRLARAARLV